MILRASDWRWLLLFLLLLLGGGLHAETSDAVAKFAAGTNTLPAIDWHRPFQVNGLGRWSYFMTLIPYYAVLGGLAWRFRVILNFVNWWHFVSAALLVMVVLGFALEWLADVLYVWDFPPGRDFGLIPVPIFGWVSGHRVPVCELGWILGVAPFFYYLWFWATLVFHDVIYVVEVVDGKERFYKKEERWVGFHEPTRILKRYKGQRGRESETPLLERPPGIFARNTRRHRHVEKT